MKAAMQGNVIRALVELITNADDSYTRLGDGIATDLRLIEVVYKKKSYSGIFAVRDCAEGMSLEDVRSSFKQYGAATSGMKDGKKVRGYFGQGAKDALATMANGKICTFKDGKFTECRIFIKNGNPWYEINGPVIAGPELRKMHKISENGTIAYFEVDPQVGRVPQLKTVRRELANNILLRKILTSSNRKVFLFDEDTGEKWQLHYRIPTGKEVLSENFSISYESYGVFPINLSVWRSDNELTQSGDDRDGGLLLLDEENAVLGMSLFKYENEPLAARFFGEVRINRFRELLENEETVLSEERDGLILRHPFCQNLVSEIDKHLGKLVKDERLRKQKEEQSKIDRDETVRYQKAFRILNEIAEVETQDTVNLGQKPTDELQEPPNGFCLYPSSAQITAGKRYVFELRLSKRIVRSGSIIRVSSSNQKIRVLTPEVKVESDERSAILRKYITIQATEPNIKGSIRAAAGNLFSEAKIDVIHEREDLLSEGMVFQPESITLRPNQPKSIYLLVYIKMIEGGSKIKLHSDNDSIRISREEIVVIESDAVKHVAKYELEISGEGVGQDAIITAEYENYIALLEVRIRSKEEDPQKSRKGLFSDPEFNFEEEPLQRTSYSAEDGKVIIYVNFPSVKHYLGDQCQFRKSLPAQVFVADLVSERCFYEVAKRKVESSGVTYSPEAIASKIQRDAYDMSRKYGKKVHEALVDQRLLTNVRSLSAAE